MKIHALQTGTVRLKESFLHPSTGRRRQLDLFLPGSWSEPVQRSSPTAPRTPPSTCPPTIPSPRGDSATRRLWPRRLKGLPCMQSSSIYDHRPRRGRASAARAARSARIPGSGLRRRLLDRQRRHRPLDVHVRDGRGREPHERTSGSRGARRRGTRWNRGPRGRGARMKIKSLTQHVVQLTARFVTSGRA